MGSSTSSRWPPGYPRQAIVEECECLDDLALARDLEIETTTIPGCGGVRRFFVCPDCHQRRRALYALPEGDGFTCRYCAGLTYASRLRSHASTSDPRARLMAHFDALDARLSRYCTHCKGWRRTASALVLVGWQLEALLLPELETEKFLGQR